MFLDFIGNVEKVVNTYNNLQDELQYTGEIEHLHEISLLSIKLLKLYEVLEVENLEELHYKACEMWDEFSDNAFKENNGEKIKISEKTVTIIDSLGELVGACPILER